MFCCRTWSDREVRTILARVRGPPLTAEAVHAMEMVAKGCDSEEHKSHPTPPNERYLDSDMVFKFSLLYNEMHFDFYFFIFLL